MINTNSIDQLNALYLVALSKISLIDSQTGYYYYPDEIEKLMFYITGSEWMDVNYSKKPVKEYLANIDGCTMGNLKSILTWCSRGERFCEGHWASVIRDGLIQKVIDRALELNGT